jgi:RNA polymerase sigma-70 factor (ECF subfamily)
MIQPEEMKLVAAFKATRSAHVFDRLYRAHNPSLYSMAIRITANQGLAEDAVHDAWLRCIERLDKFEGRSSFRTWATGILINCIREAWRREHREPVSMDAGTTTNGVPPLPHNVDPMDLEVAIASLPGGFREVLVLHDIEGFSHEEIGAMLGIVAGTSKSQLTRARQRVRELLKEDSR